MQTDLHIYKNKEHQIQDRYIYEIWIGKKVRSVSNKYIW